MEEVDVSEIEGKEDEVSLIKNLDFLLADLEDSDEIEYNESDHEEAEIPERRINNQEEKEENAFEKMRREKK